MRRAVLVWGAICLCVLAGCFSWSEDQNGNLRSVGLPGIPLWKSKAPPAQLTPADMGITPEQAAKIGGPVLVMPPDETSKLTRYRYYQTTANHCQDDLQKMLAQRASSNASGDAPYCTGTPTVPPGKGNAFVF